MRLFTYPYDQAYQPAMPVVDVRIISPHSGESAGPFTAVLDSGADGTLIPVDLLEQIDVLSIASANLRGITGERRAVKLYLVNLEIGPSRLRGIRVASMPMRTEFILGRNVLNQMTVTLNGLALVTEIPQG
jgi:predicted aspartyl protease